jgi:hypothetical protein
VLGPEAGLPSEVTIPVGALPGGGAKEQTGHRPALLVAHQVLQLLSNRTAVTQVVVLVQQTVKERSQFGADWTADFGEDQGGERG